MQKDASQSVFPTEILSQIQGNFLESQNGNIKNFSELHINEMSRVGNTDFKAEEQRSVLFFPAAAVGDGGRCNHIQD